METTTRRRPARRIWLWLLLGSAILVAIGIVLSQRAVFAAPRQPLPFNHRLHSEAGIQCLYCHSSALRSDLAGIPSLQLCIGCHQTIATDRDAVQTLRGYWEREEPIPWQPVILMADHVFFSHQPHLLAGMNCESCHGDVGQMEVTQIAIEMDMGWCLECHVDQDEEKVARLADCMACHK